MKKFTALLLAAFILLTAVGCAKKEPSCHHRGNHGGNH